MTKDTGQSPDKDSKHDKNELLLGIKYEAARLGGVEGGALADIEDQAREEIGPEWDENGDFVAGRNAVRTEHGLDRLGGEARPKPAPAEKSWRERFKSLLGG